MKLILCGDLHTGARKDDPYVNNAQRQFLTFMCDYAIKHSIDTCLQAGDWFDQRSGLTQETLNFQREFVTPLMENAFRKIVLIVGNHDMHLKNKITPNSAFEVFSLRPQFYVIQEPTTVLFGNTMWDLFPWECDENKDAIHQFIEESNSEYSLGHWELDGFEFYSGVPSTGVSREFLEKYKRAYSGHYHTISQKDNVQYLGTPYTITLGDANDVRGFWVFDTGTGEHEFVANPMMWHHKIVYNEAFDVSSISKYADKIVHMTIQKSDDRLDNVLTQLETICYKFDTTQTETLAFSADEDVELEGLLTTVNKYVDSLEEDAETISRVKRYINELHAEALAGK